MTGVWPWLAVAGAGALHGLGPATGCAVLAARQAGEGGRLDAWRTLAPIAIGQAASVAAIATLALFGLVTQRSALPWLAGGLALAVAVLRLSGRLPRHLHAAAARAGLGLGSFALGMGHGAGMMLVPALIPLCVSGLPGREIAASGSMALGLAAVAVHLAAMLAVAGATTALACRVRPSRPASAGA